MSESRIIKTYYNDPAFRNKIKEYQNEKVKCKCGVQVSRANLSHHKQTLKHKKWMEENGMNVEMHIDSLKNRIDKLEKKLTSLTIQPEIEKTDNNV